MKDSYAAAKIGSGIGIVGCRRSIGSLAGECVDRTFESSKQAANVWKI